MARREPDKSKSELPSAPIGKNSGLGRMPFYVGRETIVYKNTEGVIHSLTLKLN